MQELYAKIDSIPGDIFVLLLVLYVLILWGRKKERSKRK